MKILAKWYLGLWPVPVPEKYVSPNPLRNAEEEYREELAGGFLKWFPHLDLRGKSVLDLGSGYGGRTVRYKELGASQVFGIEIFQSGADSGAALAHNHGVEISFLVGCGESLPFPDNSFDIITSYDVFEHVEDVERVIAECHRVLKPHGTLFAVFPPFYHPTGAHFDGYLSKMPWSHLLFSCETLLDASQELLAGSAIKPNRLRPKDKLWSLNGVTIKVFMDVLKRIHFSRTKVVCVPLLSPLNSIWKPLKMRYYGFLVWPLCRIPILKEVFTHRIVCELTK